VVALFKIKTKISFKKVNTQVDKANKRNLFKAGALVRTASRRSLRKHKKTLITKIIDGKPRKVREPGPVGGPPRSTGPLKESIAFEVSSQGDSVIVGPKGETVSNVGKAQEFGGRFRGRRYRRRPFMGPALERVRSKLPKFWARSVRS